MESLTETLRWIEYLVGFSLLVQNIEYLLLRSSFSKQGAWSWDLVRRDFSGSAFFQRILDFMFGDSVFLALLFLHFVLGLSLFFSTSLGVIGFLFLMTFLISLRFRGAFNGGADSLTLLTLLCLFISRFFESSPMIAKGALLYLSLQVLLSYFFSGLMKLKNPKWRNGQALTAILNSNYYSVPTGFCAQKINVSSMKLLSQLILVFELIFPLLFLNSTTSLLAFAAAILFHLINIYLFGLNRFFYAWLAAYPALWYCSHLF